MMNRREFLRITGAGLAALALGPGMGRAAGGRKPDVLFIMIEGTPRRG